MLDFFIGVISGICSAMGVGGGSILLLYLTAFAGYDQLSAQGINLVFFLPAEFRLCRHDGFARGALRPDYSF